MVKKKDPAAFAQLAEYHWRERTQDPGNIRYEINNADTDDVDAADGQEDRVEGSGNKNIGDIGKQSIIDQILPALCIIVLLAEEPRVLRIVKSDSDPSSEGFDRIHNSASAGDNSGISD